MEVGRDPRHVGLGFGSVWVTNFGSATITRIDPLTNEVIATIEGGFGPEGIGFTHDAVWVANVRDGNVSRIDPATNTIVDTVETGTATEGIVVDPAWPRVMRQSRVRLAIARDRPDDGRSWLPSLIRQETSRGEW